jgi:ATP-dependent DNA helicase
LEELWSLLNFVNPAIFDNLEIFQSWFGFNNIGNSKGGTDVNEIVEEQQNQKV